MINKINAFFVKRSGLFFLLSFGLVSCIFEPEGIYISPIEPPDGSTSSIELTAQSDPILLYSTTSFTFNVSPSGNGYYKAVISLDDIIIQDQTSPLSTFSFVLNPLQFTNGTKELKIIVQYLSKSPSLAGQLGAEIIIFSKSWFVVVIDNTPPEPQAAPIVTIEDGKSILRWSVPSKFNFKELILVRSYLKEGNVVHVDSLKMPSLTTTQYHDQSYIGGDVVYSVDIKSQGFYVKGLPTYFTCTAISLSKDALTSRIHWSKSLLYNNNIRVEVYSDLHTLVYTTTGNVSGDYDPNTRIGESRMMSVKLAPTNPERYPFYSSGGTIKTFKGIETSAFNSIQFSIAADSYFAHTNTSLLKISKNDYSNVGSFYVDSFVSFITLSQNGQHGYLSDGRSKLYRFEAGGFVSEMLDLNSILGSTQGFLTKPIVTNNNLMSLNVMNPTTRSFIIDLTSKTIVWQKPGSENVFLSPDGEFLVYGNQVYSKGSGNWDVLIGTLPAAENWYNFTFRQDVVNHLYAHDGGVFIAYDLNGIPNGNGELPILINFPIGGSVQYDHHSQSLISRAENYFTGEIHILSASDFTEIKVVQNIWEYQKAMYVNGILFHGNGYVIPN